MIIQSMAHSCPISIHASHAGCDGLFRKHGLDSYISIHASHAGCDLQGRCLHLLNFYFNPRIPCGMRRSRFRLNGLVDVISIHASHAGCDYDLHNRSVRSHISIHTSHAGCDTAMSTSKLNHTNFNPRIPCGMRRSAGSTKRAQRLFQSTHPMRDATIKHLTLRI